MSYVTQVKNYLGQNLDLIFRLFRKFQKDPEYMFKISMETEHQDWDPQNALVIEVEMEIVV